MENVLIQIIYGIIAYLLVYLVYLITVIRKPKKLAKFMNGTEMTILKKKYNVSEENHEPKKLAKIIASTNALIIAICFSVVTLIESLWLCLLVGFVIMVVLILISYTIIGKKLGVK